jgi:hypothetical protein
MVKAKASVLVSPNDDISEGHLAEMIGGNE